MGIQEVKAKIKNIYKRREAAVFALSLQYAGMAINYFRRVQPPVPNATGKFWTNRTGDAAARMFTNAEVEGNVVSWFMAQGVQYGVYLELANDGLHEAIRPIINRYVGRYLIDLGKIYSDN